MFKYSIISRCGGVFVYPWTPRAGARGGGHFLVLFLTRVDPYTGPPPPPLLPTTPHPKPNDPRVYGRVCVCICTLYTRNLFYFYQFLSMYSGCSILYIGCPGGGGGGGGGIAYRRTALWRIHLL